MPTTHPYISSSGSVVKVINQPSKMFSTPTGVASVSGAKWIQPFQGCCHFDLLPGVVRLHRPTPG
ncbi:MAG: hypothetical protein ACREFE_17930 [Limisphaerales bacterium]